jgi:hypothetical protein
MNPRFVVPPGASPSGYSMQTGSASVWLVTLTENKRKKIALSGGAGLQLRSNDPKIVPNDYLVTESGGLRIFNLYARSTGTSMLEALGSDGSVKAYVQLRVDPLPRTGRTAYWIKLKAPNMALNAPNVVPFRMTYSPTIPWDWSAHKILASVHTGVRHLVFNCHGFPTGKKASFPAPHLSLGTTLHPGNVDAFDQLMSIWDLRVLWVSACNLADGGEGSEFCKEMAKRSGCYVVSETLSVPDRTARSSHVEDYCYAMPRYFTPDGGAIARTDFFALGPELGFELI